jgi:hypothetical protein
MKVEESLVNGQINKSEKKVIRYLDQIEEGRFITFYQIVRDQQGRELGM